MRLFLYSAWLFLASGLAGCFRSERLSGGTVETTKGIVVVSVADGGSAARVKLGMYPEGFNPLSGNPPGPYPIIRSVGHLTVSDVPAGTYNILVSDEDKGVSAIIRDVVIAKTSTPDTVEASLRKPGSLEFRLSMSGIPSVGYLTIPGTPFLARIEDRELQQDKVTVGSLPAGRYDAIRFHPDSATGSSYTFVMDAVLEPESTLVIELAPAWKAMAPITLNTSVTGAGVSETQLNFPLLVRLDSNHLDFDASGLSASRLGFVKKDGRSLLRYEVEFWDAALRRADVWVLIDTLYGNSTGQSLMAVTGGGPVFTGSDGASVFGSQNYPVLEFHLDDLTVRNVVGGGNRGAQTSAQPAKGIAGQALYMDGNAFIDFDTLNMGDTFTVSMWLKPDFQDARIEQDPQTLFANSSGGFTERGFRLILNGSANGLGLIRLETGDGAINSTVHFNGATLGFTGKDWVHLALRVDKPGRKAGLFMNGVAVNSSNPLAVDFPTDGTFRVGMFLDDSNGFNDSFGFKGVIDELTISKAILSDQRIKLQYESQRLMSGAVSIGR